MYDLDIIKKKYGEEMMHLCRSLFPTLLETPGLLSKLMLDYFEPSRFLYTDIIRSYHKSSFQNYIYYLASLEKNGCVFISEKTAKELLSDAGYDLYECKTEADIQSFKKYYARGEELCTFGIDSYRLKTCYVFFAVKKNVSEIERKNFLNPSREDEYGTSVISIQFTKGKVNTLSIKNRYNDTVDNPDNTFNNNLENIIPGLTNSFRRDYHLNFEYSNNNFLLPRYVRVNNKFYKYNYEINNVFYGPNNIVIDNFRVIDKYSKEPERYIVLDYFIIDLKEKTIELYDKTIGDSFGDEFKNIKKIIILKDKNSGNKTLEILYGDDKKAVIVINEANQMVEYHNEFLTKVDNYYLVRASKLVIFEAPNLQVMGDKCFYGVYYLNVFKAPKLIKMGNECLCCATNLISIKVPKLVMMGNECLQRVEVLKEFEAPNLQVMGDNCLNQCWELTSFKALHLREMGNKCLKEAGNLGVFEAPNLIKMGNECLCSAKKMMIFDAPKLLKVGNNSLVKIPSQMKKDISNYLRLTKIQRASKLIVYNLSKMIKENLYEIKEFERTTDEVMKEGHRK